MTQLTDEDLVRRFQKGDVSSFEVFIERYENRLIRLSRAFLYRHDSREDAVQEVFIRAFRGMPRFQFRSRPFTWLYRTLQNVCHEFNRKESGSGQQTIDEAENYIDEPQQLNDQRQLGQVFEQLAGLSNRERDVVLLRIFEEFSVEETAITLGIRKGTVKALLHRGLNKLRQMNIDIIES